MSGISINRRQLTERKMAVNLLDIVEQEIGKTGNPFFGRCDLDDLQARILKRIFTAQILEVEDGP